jgi:hypothetical protein
MVFRLQLSSWWPRLERYSWWKDSVWKTHGLKLQKWKIFSVLDPKLNRVLVLSYERANPHSSLALRWETSRIIDGPGGYNLVVEGGESQDWKGILLWFERIKHNLKLQVLLG